jgi:hypothetical protein
MHFLLSPAGILFYVLDAELRTFVDEEITAKLPNKTGSEFGNMAPFLGVPGYKGSTTRDKMKIKYGWRDFSRASSVMWLRRRAEPHTIVYIYGETHHFMDTLWDLSHLDQKARSNKLTHFQRLLNKEPGRGHHYDGWELIQRSTVSLRLPYVERYRRLAVWPHTHIYNIIITSTTFFKHTLTIVIQGPSDAALKTHTALTWCGALRPQTLAHPPEQSAALSAGQLASLHRFRGFFVAAAAPGSKPSAASAASVATSATSASIGTPSSSAASSAADVRFNTVNLPAPYVAL